MESEQVEVKDLLLKAKSVFDKYKNKVSMKNYRKVLQAISVIPEDDVELEQYFRVVDTNEDGYVSYQDFEDSILNPLIEEEESVIDQTLTDSQVPSSLLTLEKLNEFKNLFEYYKKVDSCNINEMREDILQNLKGFFIKLTEFDAFYENHAHKQIIKEHEFIEICNFYEQKILEKAAVYDQDEKDNVDVQMIDDENANNMSLEEVVMGESDSDDAETEQSSPDEILNKLYEDLQKICLKKNEVNKILKIAYKVKNIYDDRLDTAKEKLTGFKNKNDVLKNEKEYFKKKVESLKKKNEELKESNYNLKNDVDDLIKFEDDFQKMMRQNQQKDNEIMKLEDEVETYKLKIHSMELRCRR